MPKPHVDHQRRLRCAWTVLATFGFFALSLGASRATTISVGPYIASTTMPFVVPIVVHDAVDLASFTFDLAYDPTVFQIDTSCDPFSDTACDILTGPVTQGTFYTASAMFPTLFVPGFITLDSMGNQIGQLLGVSGAWQDPEPAPSGDGVLAFVEFTMSANTTTTMPITVIGTPSPPTASVPEPSTVALIFAALAFVGLRLHNVSQRAARTGRDARKPSPPRSKGPPMNTRLAAIAGLILFGALATPLRAQTTAAGPYYATPSWDQTLPASTRFIVLSNFGNQAVLDRETGLVWQRAANAAKNFLNASLNCQQSLTGGRAGWRLPTQSELGSLVDPSATVGPPFPAGHPFTGFDPVNGEIKTATTDLFNANSHLELYYFTTDILRFALAASGLDSSVAPFLCVRGPGG